MKHSISTKVLTVFLAILMFVLAFPLHAFAESVSPDEDAAGTLYIESIKMVEGLSREAAKTELENAGYTFVDQNLNEGTGSGTVYIGYKATANPNDAIYDIKLMNMNGGYTLTSINKAVEAQALAMESIASDLASLAEAFAVAYENNTVAAQKAFKALNLLRVVRESGELAVGNGLGDRLVAGAFGLSDFLEMVLFCDATIVNSVVQILTMGILGGDQNWLDKLSEAGPYDVNADYGEDEYLIDDRANQLLPVLQLYAETYNALKKSGALEGTFDENFELQNAGALNTAVLTAEERDLVNLDDSRRKLYKLAFEELAKYEYGAGTLESFFSGLANTTSATQLYPLVSVLSDGEYSAMSFGCVLEMMLGADVTDDAFAHYDEAFAQITGDTKAVYLYEGVNEILLQGDTVVAFTEEANRHIADTGEMEFYENETWSENAWETGKNITKAVAALAFGVFCLSKVTILAAMAVTCTTSVATLAASSGMLGSVVKACVAIGGLKGMIVALLIVVAVYAISYIVSRASEWWDDAFGRIEWEDNPIPEYIYDVREINIAQNGAPDASGAVQYIKKTDFVFYEVVRNLVDEPADLNAHSTDSYQWLALYVSHDALDKDAKPIKVDDFFKVKKGNGELDEGYAPLCEFGEVVAKNLNSYDEEDAVNGIYVFYRQDKEAEAATSRGYYISDIYLQTGESPEHCIALLKAANYIPININLSPDSEADGAKVYSYLGYKVTASEALALRDIRMSYTTNSASYNYGGSSYGEHGSSAGVTLYASKMTSTGTPILADGLRVLTKREQAEAGYEPVNLFSGGPAMSFNTFPGDEVKIAALEGTSYFIYFLPKVQFTSGTSYLSGISLFHNSVDITANSSGNTSGGITPGSGIVSPGGTGKPTTPNSGTKVKITDEHLNLVNRNAGTNYDAIYLMYFAPEKTPAVWNMITRYHTYFDGLMDGGVGDFSLERNEGLVYATTYNPYRAIYDVSVTTFDDMPDNLIYLQKGYAAVPSLTYRECYDNEFMVTGFRSAYEINSELVDWNASLYVTGNSAGNVYENGKMSVAQPIVVQSDFGAKGSAEPLKDMYAADSGAVDVENEDNKNACSYRLYIPSGNKEIDFTYVSNIYVTDTASIYRQMGGAKEGVEPATITRGVAMSALGNMGATHYCSSETTIYGWVQGASTRRELKANTMYYAFSKSDKANEAYTDFFLYFGGLNEGDNAPDKLYKGIVSYELVCELPLYNLTGIENSPAPRVYLYGTKNKKAGTRIVDFAVSNSPFKEGYDTIRSYSGNSLWSDIVDYLKAEDEINYLYPESDVLYMWKEFFKIQSDKDHGAWNSGIYLHVRHEGETKEEQKPYIGELMLVQLDDNLAGAREQLFAMGADGMLETSLNDTSGGYGVYLGYKRTSDPKNAITNITAYHKSWLSSSHPDTLTADTGAIYTLLADIDLNDGAGMFSDYIYLYATKSTIEGKPLVDFDIAYDSPVNVLNFETSESGWRILTGGTKTVKMWNDTDYSDLNNNGGGKYLYLTMTYRNKNPEGTTTVIDYGKDKTFSRPKVTGGKEGAYIAGLYVMDKNTIRQEKLAAGVASDACECVDITDTEVFNRLYAMGATHIISTPILSVGEKYSGFPVDNANKIFIGYSRTDNVRQAIKGVMLFTDPLGDGEPSENLHVGGNAYKLVAEAASAVTQLPKAISLIGLQDKQESTAPKIYLYTTTSGTTPIYDIVLDTNPFLAGYTTALSQNGKAPFADLSDSAAVLYQELEKEAKDPYSEINFSRYYLDGMYNVVYTLFNPADPKVSDWFLHTKIYQDQTIEEVMPYIGNVFLAEGGTRKEALIRLLENNPDGFIDTNLNQGTDGRFIYLGYKRTDDVTTYGATLTGLAVLRGSNPAKAHFVSASDALSIRYDLVSFVNLNAGTENGEAMYLFSTVNSDVGSPLTSLAISRAPVATTESTSAVLGIANGAYTGGAANLNAGTEGDALYLSVTRAVPDPTKNESATTATLIGSGSIVAIVCCLLAIAGAITFTIAKKRKASTTHQDNTEENEK